MYISHPVHIYLFITLSFLFSSFKYLIKFTPANLGGIQNQLFRTHRYKTFFAICQCCCYALDKQTYILALSWYESKSHTGENQIRKVLVFWSKSNELLQSLWLLASETTASNIKNKLLWLKQSILVIMKCLVKWHE